ncbi:MAG: very short patch repair endonuclease [Micrococcaceae bacterium]|nr:very short patch repair endonuclease [Micrococcaceae bacterium]
MDTMSAQQRSALMSKIKAKDTKPELFVRRLLHAAGYRYLLHGHIPRGTCDRLRRQNPDIRLPGNKLPGSPDIVFAARKQVIFVNGCFWHLHSCAAGAHAPVANARFWAEKRSRTRERDAQNAETLRALGFSSLVLWECELAGPGALLHRMATFLGPPAGPREDRNR